MAFSILKPSFHQNLFTCLGSGLSARVPECQNNNKNGGLDQYGFGRFVTLILPQSQNAGIKELTDNKLTQFSMHSTFKYSNVSLYFR